MVLKIVDTIAAVVSELISFKCFVSLSAVFIICVLPETKRGAKNRKTDSNPTYATRLGLLSVRTSEHQTKKRGKERRERWVRRSLF
jgi:hypothetical protein